MLGFIKKLFGFSSTETTPVAETVAPAPYKIDAPVAEKPTEAVAKPVTKPSKQTAPKKQSAPKKTGNSKPRGPRKPKAPK